MIKFRMLAAAAGALALTACGGYSAGPGSATSPLVSEGPSVIATSHSAPHHHHHHSRHHFPAPAASCDQALWQHIYHSYRLHVLTGCTSVVGTVEDVRQEPDGDLHINVRLAPRYASMVNSANDAYEHGDLVVEAICQGSITQADAAGPCQGTRWPVTVPSVGDRVRVTGSYVLDADHGWDEIHPVSYIRILAGPVTAPITAAPPPATAAPPPAPAAGGCYPKTSSGNCYEPGEFCSEAEHGETGVAGDGKSITCENTDPGQTWHWV